MKTNVAKCLLLTKADIASVPNHLRFCQLPRLTGQLVPRSNSIAVLESG